MRYAVARSRQRATEMVYRVYVTESLRNAPRGMVISTSYLDAITPREDFDADEIVDRLVSALSDG